MGGMVSDLQSCGQERDTLTSAAEGSTRLRIANQEALKLQQEVAQRQNSSKARLQALLNLPGVPLQFSVQVAEQRSLLDDGQMCLPAVLAPHSQDM